MASGIQPVAVLLVFIHGVAVCQTPNDSSPQSSGIADTAKLLGLSRDIQEVQTTRQSAAPGSAEQWKILWTRERVYERVMMASLQVDATTASIDNEIARSTEVRGYLVDKRDRNVTRANLFSALVGGGLGGTSAGLQLSTKQTTAAAATGIAGGTISAGLAIYGIRAQRGSTRTLDAESNMLAEFFGRPEMATSHFPPLIWQFLSEIAPSDPDHLTRRERLIHTWLELNRLDSLTTDSGKLKIAHVTSTPDQHISLTVDDLEDRIAMLQDVRAKLSYLKRDLAALLASLPDLTDSNEKPEAHTK